MWTCFTSPASALVYCSIALAIELNCCHCLWNLYSRTCSPRSLMEIEISKHCLNVHINFSLGISFWTGECWSGPEAAETYNQLGPASADSCLTSDYQPCPEDPKSTDIECVGKLFVNYVYTIIKSEGNIVTCSLAGVAFTEITKQTCFSFYHLNGETHNSFPQNKVDDYSQFSKEDITKSQWNITRSLIMNSCPKFVGLSALHSWTESPQTVKLMNLCRFS